MKRSFLISLLLLSLTVFATPALAQLSAGGTPPSFELNLRNDIETVIMPAIDVDSLEALEEIEYARGLPYRFGAPFDVNYSLENSGTWDVLPDGSKIWRLKIIAPLAYTMNLIYDVYWLPEGAKLFLYNEDHSQILGAFTAQNNRPHGYFGTTFLDGDVTILEYYEPAHVSQPGQIVISRVVHGYKNMRSFGDSGACNINVICPEGDDWREQIRSSGMLITSGGFRFCSGSLINNVRGDQTPYFLSANHCGVGATDVVIFNYESATCPYPGTDGPTNQTAGIAQVLSSGSPSDYSLSLLEEPIPDEYNVYFSGWNAVDEPAQTSVGIHHPSGDVKKICFDDDPATNTSWGGTPPNSHWNVNWDLGTTEGGSSGSPLYDENKRITGQLHGGTAACSGTNPNGQPDQYGKFSLTFPNVVQWLDPDGTGTLVLDGRGIDQVFFEGTVTSADDLLPIEDTYVWTEMNGLLYADDTTGTDGFYSIEVEPESTFTLHAQTLGFGTFHSDAFTMPETDTTMVVDIALELTGPPPVNVEAESNLNNILPLSWIAPPDATPDAYNVYRSEVTPDSFELYAEGITGTEFSDEDVMNGREYFYAVTAIYNADEGESFFSEVVSAIPGEVQTLPFFTDLEDDNGSMYVQILEIPDDEVGIWEWGTPSADQGPGAAFSGQNLWSTGLETDYASGADIYLLTSLIDLTNVPSAWLTINHWYRFEASITGDIVRGFDGGNVAVSTDGGFEWIVVAPQDGYDDQGIPGLDNEAGFTSESEDWVVDTFDLSPFIGSVVSVRFRLGSDAGFSMDGWFIDDISLVVDATGIEESDGPGTDALTFGLSQNHPNPFNPSTTIAYSLPAKQAVTLQIFDTSGRLVKTLTSGQRQAGNHTVTWNGTNDNGGSVTSGVYFYRLETDSYQATKRMVLLK